MSQKPTKDPWWKRVIVVFVVCVLLIIVWFCRIVLGDKYMEGIIEEALDLHFKSRKVPNLYGPRTFWLFREGPCSYWRGAVVGEGKITGAWIAEQLTTLPPGEWKRPTEEEKGRAKADPMGRLLPKTLSGRRGNGKTP